MAETVLNQLTSFVDQAIGVQSADPTIQLLDTTTWPAAPPNYRVALDAEIMLVTSCVAGLLTVTRGMEGTTAAAHAPGTVVTTAVTAGAMTSVFAQVPSGGLAPGPNFMLVGGSGSGPLAPASNVFQPLPFTISSVGPNSQGSVLGANSGFVGGLAGYYNVRALVGLSSPVPGDVTVYFYINGGSPSNGFLLSSDAVGMYGVAEWCLFLGATDEVEVFLSATVGGEVTSFVQLFAQQVA